MGETIAIMVVFFFLVVFGFSFYTRVQTSSFQQQYRRNIDLNAIQTVQKVSFLPELQCSFRNVQVDNCLDILKVERFYRELINHNDMLNYYYDLFGFSNITIKQIYPEGPTYYVYTKPLENASFSISTYVPVSLYNATSREYYIGIMEVRVYAK